MTSFIDDCMACPLKVIVDENLIVNVYITHYSENSEYNKLLHTFTNPEKIFIGNLSNNFIKISGWYDYEFKGNSVLIYQGNNKYILIVANNNIYEQNLENYLVYKQNLNNQKSNSLIEKFNHTINNKNVPAPPSREKLDKYYKPLTIEDFSNDREIIEGMFNKENRRKYKIYEAYNLATRELCGKFSELSSKQAAMKCFTSILNINEHNNQNYCIEIINKDYKNGKRKVYEIKVIY